MVRGIVFWASVLSAGAAVAQDAPSGQQVEDHAYIRIGGGATFLSDLAQDITYNPSIIFVAPPAPASQAIEVGTGFVGSAAIGFDYADGIRTELEYRYASAPIDVISTAGDRNAIPAPVNDDITAHFIFSNFYFDFANSSPLTPYIGAGVGGAFVTNENADRDAALAWQARVGLSLAMGGGFSADLEYNYMQSNKLVYGPIDEQFMGALDPARIDGDRYQASTALLSIRKAL